jgi:hypothetical protein
MRAGKHAVPFAVLVVIAVQWIPTSAVLSARASLSSSLQQAQLTASDWHYGDNFGYSVASSDSIVVVGAPFVNPTGHLQVGAAYIFVRSAGMWTQQAELFAPPGASGITPTIGDFGYSVAISGTRVVVGDPTQSAAFIFVESLGTWTQRAKLTASDGRSLFGQTVAISDSTVVVGGAGDGIVSGSAYIYALTGTTWSQQAELTAPADPVRGFTSLGISGSTVVLGAPREATGPGATYIFSGSAGTWTRQATLMSSDIAEAFGWSVAISRSTVVVGAPQSSEGLVREGVYVYEGFGTTWTQEARLTASDPASRFYGFGYSVAISGATVVVGAINEVDSTNQNYNVGTAYSFVGSGANWSQQAELRPSDVSTNPGYPVGFGFAISIAGYTMVVGAPGHSGSTGAAYVYDLSRIANQSSAESPQPRAPASQSTPGPTGPHVPTPPSSAPEPTPTADATAAASRTTGSVLLPSDWRFFPALRIR